MKKSVLIGIVLTVGGLFFSSFIQIYAEENQPAKDSISDRSPRIDIGFKETWRTKTDLARYTDIYIFSVDLRDLKKEISDGDETSTETIDSVTMENIAHVLYKNFSQKLSDIFTVRDAVRSTPASPMPWSSL